MSSEERTRRYYDDFSETYDRGRDRGYHALIDRLESAIVIEHARGERVLEVGCGTGLVLEKVALHAERAIGLDPSRGMIARARARGLEVVRGSATAIPFAERSFGVVYSLKVLAHIPEIAVAVSEIARVTRPGGVMLLEFYNRWSLRYLARLAAGARRIGRSHTEADVPTRWDDPRAIRAMLPRGCVLEDLHGVRVLTPAALLHRVPILAPLLARAEERASRGFARALGGFLVARVRRVS